MALCKLQNKVLLAHTLHNFKKIPCEEIRELYNWANIYNLEFYYRLDNSKDNYNKRKIGAELVITNYDININNLKHAVVSI